MTIKILKTWMSVSVLVVFMFLFDMAYACQACGCKPEKEPVVAKNACPADCEKACCAQKACPADCEKACCTQKACCKKAAPADSAKSCCPQKDTHVNAEQGLSMVAPAFELPNYDGQIVKLGDYEGKIVVLEWANYDCPFTKYHYDNQRDTMNRLAADFKTSDVVFLTINSTHYATIKTNAMWVKDNQINHHVLLDKDGQIGKAYDAQRTPHMFIIDKEGRIVYEGAIDNAPFGRLPEEQEYVNYVQIGLEELIAGKKLSMPKTNPYGCTVKYMPKN